MKESNFSKRANKDSKWCNFYIFSKIRNIWQEFLHKISLNLIHFLLIDINRPETFISSIQRKIKQKHSSGAHIVSPQITKLYEPCNSFWMWKDLQRNLKNFLHKHTSKSNTKKYSCTRKQRPLISELQIWNRVLRLFRMGGGSRKNLPTSYFPVTFANLGISLKLEPFCLTVAKFQFHTTFKFQII